LYTDVMTGCVTWSALHSAWRKWQELRLHPCDTPPVRLLFACYSPTHWQSGRAHWHRQPLSQSTDVQTSVRTDLARAGAQACSAAQHLWRWVATVTAVVEPGLDRPRHYARGAHHATSQPAHFPWLALVLAYGITFNSCESVTNTASAHQRCGAAFGKVWGGASAPCYTPADRNFQRKHQRLAPCSPGRLCGRRGAAA
jgi:hypothetical protein